MQDLPFHIRNCFIFQKKVMKLAVIFESSPFDRKGLFNAVHNRIKGLLEAGCEVDAYCIHSRDNLFTRRVRHTPETPDVEAITVDGITYRFLWYRFSVIDDIIHEKFKRRPLLFQRFIRRNVGILKDYDAVCAHSFTGGLLAYEAHKQFGVDYYVSWHGSDIHTHPWRIDVIRKDTAKVMESAKCNFFVSKALCQFSERIASGVRKEVLYNGVSESFVRVSDSRRAELRSGYGVGEGEKIVAFVGSIVKVKNVRMLADIFASILDRYDGKVCFWMVGDGKLRSCVEADFKAAGLSDKVRMWGDVAAEEMPDVMNCIDVLILPSLNEGLPLVCAEAMRCGVAVVGADVGGVSEIIGSENVVPHGDGFVDAFAEKVVMRLHSSFVPELPAEFSWKETSAREVSILNS